MSKKFVNALIPTYGAAHVQAVLNEAERLGYTSNLSRNLSLHIGNHDSIKVVHLEGNGTLFAYAHFTAEELLNWDGGGGQGQLEGAVIIKKLRKLRTEFELLNSTESQDNQAVLGVRPKYEIVPYDPDAYLHGELPVGTYKCNVTLKEGPSLVKDYIIDPLADPAECTCPNPTDAELKACRLVKAYGGTCGKQFAQAEQRSTERVTWVRPKADNNIVNSVVRWYVLAASKVVSVVRGVFQFLKGGK